MRERRQQGHDVQLAEHRRRCNPQHAGGFFRYVRRHLPGSFQLTDDRCNTLEINRAGLRGFQFARAALEEADAQFVLQTGDGAGDRRGRHTPGPGDLGEAAVSHDLHKQLEGIHIH